MIKFKTVDTFSNFLLNLPGANGNPQFYDGDLIFCSQTQNLYKIGSMGDYGSCPIVNLSFSTQAERDSFPSSTSTYDPRMFYRYNNKVYTWNSTSSAFEEVGSSLTLSVGSDNTATNENANNSLELATTTTGEISGKIRLFTPDASDGIIRPLVLKYGKSVPGSISPGTITFVTDGTDSGMYVDLTKDNVNTRLTIPDASQIPSKNHASNLTDYGISAVGIYGHAKSLDSSLIGEGVTGGITALPALYAPTATPTTDNLLGSASAIFAKVDHTHQLPTLVNAYGITATAAQINNLSSFDSVFGLTLKDTNLSSYVPADDAADPHYLSYYLEKVNSLNTNAVLKVSTDTVNPQSINTALKLQDKAIYSGNSILSDLDANSHYNTFNINAALAISGTNAEFSVPVTFTQTTSFTGVASFTSGINTSTSSQNTLDGSTKIDANSTFTLANNLAYEIVPAISASPSLRLLDPLYCGTSNNDNYIGSDGSIHCSTLVSSGNISTATDLGIAGKITLNGSEIIIDKASSSNSDKDQNGNLYWKLRYKYDGTTQATFLTTLDLDINLLSSKANSSATTIPTSSAVQSYVSSVITDLGLGTASKLNAGSAIGNVPILGNSLGTTENYPLVTTTDGKIVPYSGGTLKGLAVLDAANNKTSSMTVPYSASYIDSNFIPRSLITKKYLIRTNDTNASSSLTAPTVVTTNYLSLTTTNTTFDWSSTTQCLNVTLSFDSDTTISITDAITLNLQVALNRNANVEYGATIIGPDGSTVIGNQQTFGIQNIVGNSSYTTVTNIKFDVIFNAVVNTLNISAGQQITIKIFQCQNDATQLISRFLCGVSANSVNRFSYLEINFNGVYLNTNQLTDGAVTMSKLNDEVVTALSAKVVGSDTSTINNIAVFNSTTGKVIKDSGISYTSIMQNTDAVWIKTTAALATSTSQRAKLLIDTSDNNILKYWDGTAWTGVTVAWA